MKKRLLTFLLSLAVIVAMMPLLPAEVHAAQMPIQIDGITPVVGETPVTIDGDYTVSTPGYQLTAIEWYDDGSNPVKGKFQPGVVYYVSLTFKADTTQSEEGAVIEIDGESFYYDTDSCDVTVEGNIIRFNCWFHDIPVQDFAISTVDYTDNVIQTSSPGMTFKMKKYNGNGKVTFYWYNCDKNGKISGKAIYSNTTGKFTMNKLGYNKGLHYVAVRAKDADGNWSNKIVLKLKIYYDLSKANIKVKDRTYNGKSGRKPEITIKARINGVYKTLKQGTDYKLSFRKAASKRKNVGPYTFMIEGKGYYIYDYEDETDGDFDYYDWLFLVNPKGTSVSSITPGSKKLTVNWKKQSEKMSKSRITGYQVQVATDKKFTKGKKTYLVKGYSKTSKTFKNLKGGKKYYVRVRTYKVIDGDKYFSSWSKVKVRTTKK